MLWEGDSLERLKELEADSIDSLVTDPPAGISFMGKDWDGDKGGKHHWIFWMTEVMLQVFRVMKPGAHGLVWAIPRTSHWTATALENAGFEVRDVITHLFGSGFPKSLDISKSMDKAKGAQRTQILGERHDADKLRYLQKEGGYTSESGWKVAEYDLNVYAPATDLAKQWQGFGTALKPAVELWWLIRKPLSEKTIASNVEKWGCGGINIDGTRIEGEVPKTSGAGFSGGKYANSHRSKTDQDGFTHEKFNPTQGRFPANLVLSHDEECDEECTETCAVKALDQQSGVTIRTDLRTHSKTNLHWNKKPGSISSRVKDMGGGASRFFYCSKASKRDRNGGIDGSECIWETDVWEKLDLSLLMENISQLPRDTFDGILMESIRWNTDGSGNSITEKFRQDFKFTIKTVSRLITELKTLNVLAPSNTKESIQGAIRTIEANGLNLAETAAFIRKFLLTSIDEKTAIAMNASAALFDELLRVKNLAKIGNFHATVKSTKLMEYLCTLITPPNGTILDPFMGSGSTGVAAKRLGFKFIGIERDGSYLEIAKQRIQNQTESLLK